MIEIPEGGYRVLAAQEAKLGLNATNNKVLMVDASVPPADLPKLEQLEAGLEDGSVVIPKETDYLGFTHAVKETTELGIRAYFVRLEKKVKPPVVESTEPPLTIKQKLAKMSRSPPNKIADVEKKRTVKRSPSFTREEEERVVKMCKSHSNNVNGYIHDLIMLEVEKYEAELANKELEEAIDAND